MQKRFAMFASSALVVALLTACGAATTTVPAATVAPAATSAPVVVEAPAATAVPAATEAPAATTDPYASGSTAPTTDPYASGSTAPTTAPEATVAPAATAAPATSGSTTAPTGMRVFVIDSANTTASYAVQEVFLRQNLPFRAVGTTNEVEGTFAVNADGTPSGEVTNITVNLPSLKSDSDRRDGAIQRDWLQSNTFPLATFKSTGVEGIPASYTEGEEVTFRLIGDLTIRDVTRSVTFDVTGKLEGDVVTGSAKANIKMTDFGFNPPDIAGFVTVEDDVEISINFTANAQ